jgi:hypothetical protein
MILLMAHTLKNRPAQRAPRVGTVKRRPFVKILKMPLVHVPGESERGLESPSPNLRGETTLPEPTQKLGSRSWRLILINHHQLISP